MSLDNEIDRLKRVPLFAALDPAKLKLFVFTSEALDYSDGEMLIHKGDMDECAYLVMQGEVEVLADSGEVAVVLGEDQLIGELALFNRAPRNADVRARGKLRVLRIEGEMLMKQLRESPQMALAVIEQLSARLAQAHSRAEQLQKQVNKGSSATGSD